MLIFKIYEFSQSIIQKQWTFGLKEGRQTFSVQYFHTKLHPKHRV
jgi:hypothetical protein